VVRFQLNRRWALILALGVSLACSFVSSQAVAIGPDGGIIGDPTDPGLGPPPPGDPDLPSGPGAKTVKPGGLVKGHDRVPGKRAVGDGQIPRSAWMWRLRVVVQGLRSFYIRF
jgi:hypothetical protein